MVCSPNDLAASSRCRPSTSTKRAPSSRTRIGVFLAIREDALRDFLDALWVERSPALYGYIDFVDREGLAFHHGGVKR